jgi:hypothetical protein
MSNLKTQIVSFNEWQILKKLILEVAKTKTFDRASLCALRQENLISLLDQFLISEHDYFLENAARLVATLKPGVNVEMAEKHPWLVLEHA